MTDPELLPIGEAARLLGVSVRTLQRWENAGKVPAGRNAGNQRRFRRDDLERLRATLLGDPRATTNTTSAPASGH